MRLEKFIRIVDAVGANVQPLGEGLDGAEHVAPVGGITRYYSSPNLRDLVHVLGCFMLRMKLSESTNAQCYA